MNKIGLLDCTLRDGGYINNWKFGYESIESIIKKLNSSNVEYIECGYLSEKKGGDPNSTQFRCLEDFYKVVASTKKNQKYALMIDFGQISIEHIPAATSNAPTIRVCFHKKDLDDSLCFCEKLMKLGYEVFVQPMATLNYSDVELIELITKVNKLSPKCVYIVDSFGVIEIDDFQRLLFIFDHNLRNDITLGYHAHNNLQQAYGNAKYMIEQRLKHDVLIDASVYGMGRGAGNLNMELFASYLNKQFDKNYAIDSFLEIMDQYLKPIFAEHYWGYSLPFYLSAQYNCHPNYAAYFADKNTLNNKSMRQLLASLPDDVKCHYSVDLAEKFYQKFQKNSIDDSEALSFISSSIMNRDVLLLAPGRSILDEKDNINSFIEKNKPVIIAINVIPNAYKCDYVFCSNEKRLKYLNPSDECRLIISSNIKSDDSAIIINYSSYLGQEDLVADNPALMVIRMLVALGLHQIFIAGLDGYSATSEDNYFDASLALGTSVSVKNIKNRLIKNEIGLLRNKIDIQFLTDSKYNAND